MKNSSEQNDMMRSGDSFAAKLPNGSNEKRMGGGFGGGTPSPKGMIMTVSGPIEPSELGFCHAHEHLFNVNSFLRGPSHDLIIDDYDRTAEELRLFKAAGGGSVVDAQPVGCGRAEGLLELVSLETGVHIVASTGFHKLGFYPEGHWIHTLAEENLTRLFLDEIEGGMFGGAEEYPLKDRVQARSGVIKVACDSYGITGRYEALFSAAAEAAKASGLPLLVHLEMGQRGGEVLEFFAKRGMQPGSLILCHLDRTLEDLSRILEAAQAGAFLEFDTIGRFKYHDDGSEVAMILGLIEEGFAGSILLGLDTTRSRMKAYGGTIGLDYITTSFLPRLRQAGLPESIVHSFMHENPARAFTIKPQKGA